MAQSNDLEVDALLFGACLVHLVVLIDDVHVVVL